MRKLSYKIVALVCIMLLCTHMAFSQDAGDAEQSETELVIEDFGTTGLGDSTSFGISIGGLFKGGSALVDINFDFFVSPLVGIRLGVVGSLPFTAGGAADTDSFATDIGAGAIWRSYVINRVRFYGGLMLRAGIAPVVDQDILLIPEGFGGFEFFASPSVSIYGEFGGRTAIPVITLNGGNPATEYLYAEGFFFKIGTRFDF